MPASGPGAGSVRFAALPTASSIVPSAPSAPVPSYCRPPGALSPGCTSYLNTSSASPPMPCTYDALWGGEVARASIGMPVTVTSSSKVTAMSIVWPMPYVLLGELDSTETTRGATASSQMPCPASGPGAGSVRFAALPTASSIVPSAPSAPVPSYCRPPGALSPGCTSYLNTSSASPPMPCTYDALWGGEVARASIGMPVTVTSSSKVTAMSIVWPMPYVPLGEAESTVRTLGRMVSSVMAGPAKSLESSKTRSAALPAASTTEPAVSAPVPLWRSPSGALSPGCTS